MQIYPPGTQIGQYEIASLPMMGGMGVVYFALDHGNDGHPVALKTFRPEFLSDRAARDRFLREGTAWIELGRHPHIVRCYEVEYIDPTAFLVLELIAKEQNMPDASLRSWLIPGHPLALEQALLFALQIARGMQYATEKIPGFVHRDLKPENILVGADKLPGTDINRLRVTDFGLVKTIADSGELPPIGNAEELKPNQIQFTRGVGTPLYMAPEQWKGEPVGVFTDIYAFGCILYEILTGQHAAEGKTITELQVSHCEEKPQPFLSNFPNDLSILITKCLVLNPTHRFVSWNEIVNSLEQIYTVECGQRTPQLLAKEELSREEEKQAGSSYAAIGNAYSDIGKTEMATRYLEKALVIAHENNNRVGESMTLRSLGDVYIQSGDMRQAIVYLDQGLTITREIRAPFLESAILNSFGMAYFQLGDLQRAIIYHKEALQIIRKLGDLRSESSCLNNLGNVYLNMGDAQQAIESYEQALTNIREVGYKREEGYTVGNLGIAYSHLDDNIHAIDYYNQALNIAREIGDRYGEERALNNIGDIYRVFGNTSLAIKYFEQALAVAREIGDRIGEGNVFGNLGQTYDDLGNMENAIRFYKQSMAITRESRNLYGLALVLRKLAGLYSQMGDKALALPLAQEAANTFERVGNLQFAQQVRQFITQLTSGGSSPIYETQSNLVKAQSNMMSSAAKIFQRVLTFQDMEHAASLQPVLVHDNFIQAMEMLISEKISPELKPAFEQKLAWLRQIATQKRPPQEKIHP